MKRVGGVRIVDKPCLQACRLAMAGLGGGNGGSTVLKILFAHWCGKKTEAEAPGASEHPALHSYSAVACGDETAKIISY